MRNNSVVLKILFFTGVLLLGALLFFKYSHRGTSTNAVEKNEVAVSLKDNKSEVQPLTILSEPKEVEKAPAQFNSEEQRKWGMIQEIMKSKNDNDPRLDKEFRDMTLAFHAELFHQYQTLPMESRNERGLIAFLIARDIKNSQDMEFLKSIYNEKPCMSLNDCTTTSESDPHLAGIDQTSVNYPQLAALYQIEKQLNSGNKIFESNDFKDQLRQVLAHASQFPVPMVQKKADAIKAAHPL